MSDLVCTSCGQPLGPGDRFCPRCRQLALLCKRYLVQRDPLGSGGFGTVYEAADTTLGRRCAVKVIPCSPADVARVEREVRSLVHLSDAGLTFVPSIYDVDHEDPRFYYIVMEYITGPTLDQITARAWSAEQVAAFLETMLEHLAQLHDAGVIHRDIKPANIKRPRPGEYVLLDFGIAKHITDTHSQKASTIAYAPIEQIGSRGGSGPHSDLFSLGVTAYELLAGRLPPSVTDRQRGELLERPGAVAPDVGPALEATLLAMLAFEPADRPPDARTALALLRGEMPSTGAAVTVRLAATEGSAQPSTFRPLLAREGKGRIVGLATDPADRYLAVATTLGVWLYDPQTLAARRLIETDGPITALAVVDGGAALTATWRDMTRRFSLDTARGPRLSAEHTGAAAPLAVSPDGRRIAAHSPSGLVIIPLGDGAPPVILEGAIGGAQQLCFSFDGALLAAGVRREALVWRAADGALLWRLGEHSARVSACSFDPSAQLLAVAAGPSVTLYRVSDGRRVRELTGPGERIGGLAFSPNGALLAASGGPQVRLWTTADGTLAPAPGPQPTPVIAAGFVDGGRALVLATEQTITRYATDGTGPSHTATGHLGRLFQVAWAAGDTLVSGGDTACLWALRGGRLELLKDLGATVGPRGSLAVSPDSATIAVAGPGGVSLWRAADGARQGELSARPAATGAMAFTTDGAGLVVLAESAEIWPLAGGQPARIEGDIPAGVSELALAAGCGAWAALDDAGAYVWRLPSGASTATLSIARLEELLGSSPASIALSAEGGTLAVVGEEAVALIDLAGGAPPQRIAAEARYVAFAPGGRTLALVGGSTIDIWRAVGGPWQQRASLAGHADFVSAVAFHADGRLLASVAHDGTLRVWQTEEKSS